MSMSTHPDRFSTQPTHSPHLDVTGLLADVWALVLAAALRGRVLAGRLIGWLAGEHPRIAMGPPVDVPLRLRLMLEDDGTLLTRWDVARPSE